MASGDYGLVYRVLRMVDGSKQVADEEDPHLVLDIPKGSDRGAIAKAYRRLARRWHPDKVKEEEHDQAFDRHGNLLGVGSLGVPPHPPSL